MAVLVRKVETQRLQQMKMLARPGHRHIEEPALLVDLLGSAACHIRRNTSFDEVENKDSVPFLPLGRMNGRQDQIVLVELRAAGIGAAGIGRVQCQLGQKALAGDVTGGNLLELVEIRGAHAHIIIEAFKLRHSRTSSTWPVHGVPTSRRRSIMRQNPGHGTNAAAGGVSRASAVAAKPSCESRSMTSRAVAGPMPGCS